MSRCAVIHHLVDIQAGERPVSLHAGRVMMVVAMRRWPLLLLLLLLLLGEGGSRDTRSCRVTSIDVIDVDETTSNFTYSISVENEVSCSRNDHWQGEIISCHDGHITQECQIRFGGGVCWVGEPGSWSLTVEHVKSGCFDAPGRNVIPNISIWFNVRGLNITVAGSDKRVKSWTLYIFKARRKEENPPCNQIILLQAEGYVPLMSPVEAFSHHDSCFPKPLDVVHTSSPLKRNTLHVVAVVGAATLVVLGVGMLLVLLGRRSPSKLGAGNELHRKFYNSHGKASGAGRRELLLLCTHDVIHHPLVKRLTKMLQGKFNVYDLCDYGDPKRLQDSNEWLMRKLVGVPSATVPVEGVPSGARVPVEGVPSARVPVEGVPSGARVPVEGVPSARVPVEGVPSGARVPVEGVPSGARVPVEGVPSGARVPVEGVPSGARVPVEGVPSSAGVTIVLVTSPALNAITRTLLNPNNEADTVLTPDQDHHHHHHYQHHHHHYQHHHYHQQLIFALRIIINSSLIRDYSRVFVVRLGGGAEEDVQLMVASRRYDLDTHFDRLLYDISV
ncbi:uncharacterized protein [Procambarus clarkii]|uniref:uncharacterized protein isoform X2 n=1 Tax=Procambarus clarkii TaxID=6728 RepID=UPI001E67525F|nr:uncharacterized protein LOC123767730 isoform X2 [Procambarus clarkii]